MGAVCAVVYLLVVIIFIPFPFYKDIVAATSGGGNRDVVFEIQHLETGRLLHKFPHSKVDHHPHTSRQFLLFAYTVVRVVSIISVRSTLPSSSGLTRSWGRSL